MIRNNKVILLVDPTWYLNETTYHSHSIPILELMYEVELPPGKYVLTTLRGSKSGKCFYVDPLADGEGIANLKIKPALDFSLIDYITYIKSEDSSLIKTVDDFVAYPSGSTKLPPEQQLANKATEHVVDQHGFKVVEEVSPGSTIKQAAKVDALDESSSPPNYDDDEDPIDDTKEIT